MWEDITIFCTSVTKFEVWNTTSMRKIHEFYKEYPETTVFVNDGYYYLYEYEGSRLQQFSLTGTKINHFLLPLPVALLHDPLRVYDGCLFYISSAQAPKAGLHIHNMTNMREIKYLPLNTPGTTANRWFLTQYGAYKVQTLNSPEMVFNNNARTKLNYYDTNGVLKLNVTIPDCLQTISADINAAQGVVSSSKYFVYVGCGNIVTQLAANDGSIVRQFGAPEPTVFGAVSTEDHIFFFFKTGVVIQFDSLEGQNVASYGTGAIVLSNQLFLVSNNYLAFPLCPNSNSQIDSCRNPVLHLYPIKDQSTRTKFKHISKSTSPYDVYLLSIKAQKKTPNRQVNLATFTKRFSDVIQRNIWQNSFFTPAVYQDTSGTTHFIYFSGGGNVHTATCSDRFLHEIAFFKNKTTSQLQYKFSTFHSMNPSSFSTSSYASILIKYGKIQYYIIHGGISCDLDTIFTEVYAIPIDGIYVARTIETNQIIP
jgi:hypothetical protein